MSKEEWGLKTAYESRMAVARTMLKAFLGLPATQLTFWRRCGG